LGRDLRWRARYRRMLKMRPPSLTAGTTVNRAANPGSSKAVGRDRLPRSKPGAQCPGSRPEGSVVGPQGADIQRTSGGAPGFRGGAPGFRGPTSGGRAVDSGKTARRVRTRAGAGDQPAPASGSDPGRPGAESGMPAARVCGADGWLRRRPGAPSEGQPMAIIRSIGRRARSAMSGGTVTSWVPVSRVRRSFDGVIIFM
jgi:hypothetical protein